MIALNIAYVIAQLAIGDKFMWNETGNLTFEVVGIHHNPQAAFAGNKLAPFADVIWSDDKGKVTTMNLASLQNYVRTGQALQEN